MIDLSAELAESFAKKLAGNKVPVFYHNFYREWLRFNLDFCPKYSFSPSNPQSLITFLFLSPQTQKGALTLPVCKKASNPSLRKDGSVLELLALCGYRRLLVLLQAVPFFN